ncbi:MAG: DJ-1/PfpI family protein [Coriobacteriia bacterium]|nr:DJ-1/PfpI family protein [Coriobacteriia bacterium]
MTTTPAPKRVLLLLGPAFEDAEAVVALTACGWSRYRAGLPPIDVHIAALDPQVTGKFGTTFAPHVLIPDVDPGAYDGLVIPGGFRSSGFERIYQEPVYDLIRAIHAQGAPIATMCVGILPVARAGLLRGKPATTYAFSRHSNYAILEEHGAQPVHAPVAEADGIISCAGPAYSEQVMARFLELLLGQDAARDLAQFRAGIEL